MINRLTEMTSVESPRSPLVSQTNNLIRLSFYRQIYHVILLQGNNFIYYDCKFDGKLLKRSHLECNDNDKYPFYSFDKDRKFRIRRELNPKGPLSPENYDEEGRLIYPLPDTLPDLITAIKQREYRFFKAFFELYKHKRYSDWKKQAKNWDVNWRTIDWCFLFYDEDEDDEQFKLPDLSDGVSILSMLFGRIVHNFADNINMYGEVCIMQAQSMIQQTGRIMELQKQKFQLFPAPEGNENTSEYAEHLQYKKIHDYCSEVDRNITEFYKEELPYKSALTPEELLENERDYNTDLLWNSQQRTFRF